jgi:hypothetical protein
VIPKPVYRPHFVSSIDLFESATAVVNRSRHLAEESRELLDAYSSSSEDSFEFSESPARPSQKTQSDREVQDLSLSLIRRRGRSVFVEDKTSLSDSFMAVPAPVHRLHNPEAVSFVKIAVASPEHKPIVRSSVTRVRPLVERESSSVSEPSPSPPSSPVQFTYEREDGLESESSGLNFNIVDSSEGEFEFR